MKKTFILMMLSLYASYNYAQGLILDGFMQKKGDIISALSFSTENYDTYYVGEVKTQNPNLGTITTNSTSLYVVGGITDYLNVVVNLPYISSKPSAGFWSPQSDFQDLSIFLKGRLFNHNFESVGQFSLSAGLGYSTPISQYIADAPISIGHQAKRTEFRLLVQHQLPMGLFIMAQGGYLHNYNVTIDRGYEVLVPDAFDFTARIGGNIKSFYADAWLSNQIAKKGTNIGPGVPFPGNAISFLRTGFNLYSTLPFVKNLGVSAGMGFTLSGENIGKATRISGGLVYKLSVLK
ncbi:hypothetical protein JKA74_02480 [Marivirga sp. S37H4]|uniref:Outer membrane protein beta-barrel domain-containing protein n=1 Tax=Marivirga aurantiaca TaxID=2802615 RepID=A0A935C5M5_9BACT|nr:hypothetical protein [Marivirga aurantiaca]MBK6263890.1 hypothetical protein [Marivirga aurantiaca]